MSQHEKHVRGYGFARRVARSRTSWAVVFAVALFTNGGCVQRLTRWVNDSWTRDSWVADYDTAEQCVCDTGRDMLVLYQDDRKGRDRPVERVLKSDAFEGLASRYVCCLLLRSHEPDRRYVAQYGVDRAPALIVIHPDGTYHAKGGSPSASEISDFLASARPPGAQPHLNPYLARRPRYRWLDSIDSAEVVSRQTGRPLLVVFYRSFAPDWRKIKKLLSAHEVYMRLTGLVPVRIGRFRRNTKAYISRFGTLRLPALVIAHPDGTHEVLELPQSSEAVVRFADSALRPSERRRASTESPDSRGLVDLLGSELRPQATGQRAAAGRHGERGLVAHPGGEVKLDAHPQP